MGGINGAAACHDINQVKHLKGIDKTKHQNRFIVGFKRGSVILKKDCILFAPSMDALSYNSFGMVVSPVEMRIILNGIPIHTLAQIIANIAVFADVSQSIFLPIRPRLCRIKFNIPTSVPNINLKIKAVTVIGIIQGIIKSPRMGLESRKF